MTLTIRTILAATIVLAVAFVAVAPAYADIEPHMLMSSGLCKLTGAPDLQVRCF